MGCLERENYILNFYKKPDLAEECEDIGQGSGVDDDPPGGKDEGEERQAGCHWLSDKDLGCNFVINCPFDNSNNRHGERRINFGNG